MADKKSTAARGIKIELTERQMEFVTANCFEVLFGGAAGGGKSYAQMIDALVFALKYPGSRQLILRRTRPELERTLVRYALQIYPGELYSYSKTEHIGRFSCGSSIEFGYCDEENDVYRYQSAEYDVIRFDELTHFTEFMYRYLISRVRGANGYPKQIKSSTNPGGVGHGWVKRRFIDPMPPKTEYLTESGSRIFLPARVQDNLFLTDSDPDYVSRLNALPERERRALLLGDWDLVEGRYFDEFRRDIHVVRPFEIPHDAVRIFAMDYGLDMLAAYWIALLPNGRAVVYRELYESGLIISEAAQRVLAAQGEGERISHYLAPPDLWNRRQESGASAAELFGRCGLELIKAPSGRVSGWYALREWLKPLPDEYGGLTPRLVLFDCCVNAVRALCAIAHDRTDPNDCASSPHELTHAPDALRYFAAACADFIAPRDATQPPADDFSAQLASLAAYGR